MSALEQDRAGSPYAYAEKIARPEPSLALGDTVLKWYDVAPDDEGVPLAVRALARRCLRDAHKDGGLGALGRLGFVILHRCDEDSYSLLVCTWCGEDELWETIWTKRLDDVLFRPLEPQAAHRRTYCVSELGVVAHEREAWMRVRRSASDADAMHAYLRDCLDGLV